MKKLFFFSFIILSQLVTAQISDPVKWKCSVLQECEEATLVITAAIEPHWHVYSQYLPNDNGPIASTFSFDPSADYELKGKVTESGVITKFDPMFEMEVSYFENKAVFKQKIKVKSKKDFKITGFVNYMVCDESKCLPPEDRDLLFQVKGLSGCADQKTETITETEEVKCLDCPVVNADSTVRITPVGWTVFPARLSAEVYELRVNALVDTGWHFAPELVKFKLNLPEGITEAGEWIYPEIKKTKKLKPNLYSSVFSKKLKVTAKDSVTLSKVKLLIEYAVSNDSSVAKLAAPLEIQVNLNEADGEIGNENKESYLWIFLGAFLSGFLALLTPCVFPMIPMTVSFFLKTSKTKKQGIANALKYGISIIVIYVLLGMIISAAFGSDALNALSTNVFFNIFFFILLVIFAVSFLGAFEIVLPNSWVNAADKRADRGGFIGIFFMAFTLALVSFSCTGPIIGTQLVVAAQQGGMGPFFAMFGFSLAIAIPFTLFAVFPGWLNSMPQSGGWLNTVKVSLGFLELALALKFLSNADLVVQAHLLEREVFLALWIIIFSLWAFYLLGKIKLSHDSDLPYVTTTRLLFAVFIFSFVVYMVPGMWGAPLKWIAGFPPPLHYSESPYGIGGEAPSSDSKLPPHAEYGPHKLVTFHDYHYALDYAKEIGKPLLVDFTGYACVNCRKMEENVWSDPAVLDLLSNEMVIASLHVDEKTLLPAEEQYVSVFDGKKIRSFGNKWSDMQKSKYGNNSQPFYVLLDHNENTINGSASYESHGKIDLFHVWLKEGLKKYATRKDKKENRPEMLLTGN